jgi:AAA domain
MSVKNDISKQFKSWRDRLEANENPDIESGKLLLTLYDYLLTNKITPPVFNRITNKKARPKSFNLQSAHVGQMGDRFPLSPSQRQAMGHCLELPDDCVLAVNGPPGTGKTTLIQSVVANMVVETALAGNQPALIVASSAGNQAITNIVNSFASGGTVNRWLPDVSSFGLYLTGTRQAEKSLLTNLLGQRVEGSIGALMTPEFYVRASSYYLRQFNAEFKTQYTSIEKARNHIHTLLRQLQSDYKKLVKANNKRPGASTTGNLQADLDSVTGQIDEATARIETAKSIQKAYQAHRKTEPGLLVFFSFIPFVWRKLTARNRSFLQSHGISEQIDLNRLESIQSVLNDRINNQDALKKGLSEKRKSITAILDAENQFLERCRKMGVNPSLTTIDDELDTGHRSAMFDLATHYWEARWLEDLAEWNRTEPSEKSRMGSAYVLGRYRMHAKIFPCFISTAYSIPRFFNYYVTKSESKPLLNEIDLLIFDEAGQIPAEVGVAVFALCKKSVVFGDVFQIEPIASPGLLNNPCDAHEDLISGGESLMSVAHMLTEISYDGKNPGLILTEHRRCLPEIIGYCNELAYGGMLKSLRTGPPGVFPAMSLIQVVGKILHKDRSHYNQAEATAIINWIVENRGRIESHYRKGIKDTVGVITPFRPQADLITSLLKEAGLTGITVGTNHSLQGAERDIILYSSVYDRQSSPTFLNGRVNLLNVAVSRARDSFILFADGEMIKACPSSSPLGLLGTRLKPIN